MLLFINDDPFFTLLAEGPKAKPFLVEFATAVLKMFQEFQECTETTFKQFWKHEASQPIREIIRRLTDVMTCVLHIHCAEMPDGYEASSDKSVMVFTKYSGPLILETAMRATLLEEGSWLANEVSEMVRTGASARMCEHKFQELKELLKTPWEYPAAKTIRQCCELHGQVKQALRPAMTVEVSKDFAAKLLQAMVAAENILNTFLLQALR